MGTRHVLGVRLRRFAANPTYGSNWGDRAMKLAFVSFTLLGPIVGAIGFYLSLPIVFWIGVGLAGLNLFMNLASGVMKLPLLPGACVILGGMLLFPWYEGAGTGLLAWTALEGAGELISPMLGRRA
jgi:hypothetical protein